MTISTHPVNPDLDIPASGRFEAYSSNHLPGSVDLFDPAGHYKCTIPNYTYHYLIGHPYSDQDELIPRLTAEGTFLLSSKAAGIKTAQMPSWIMNTLLTRQQDWVDTTSTALSITPGCKSFLTPPNQPPHPASSGTWFSTAWTGFHILHHIPSTHSKKALRWALTSSQQEHTPTAIIAMVPHDDKWGAPWKDHPGAILLAIIPPHLATSQKGVTSGAKARATTTPKDRQALYLFANATGRSALFPTWSHMAAKELLSAHQEEHSLIEWAHLPTHPSNQLSTASKFMFQQPKALALIIAANMPHPSKKHTPTLAQHSLPPSPAPAWQDNNTWHVYTDGSRVKVGVDGSICGAGVYIHQTQQSYTVDPAGQGETNTINRAELGAEAGALEVIPDTQPATIFTDSLCSLLQINKYLLHPSQLKYHTHLPMIKEITHFLLKRASMGTPTHFAKVKGHAGVVGNEKADRLAAKARDKKDIHPGTHRSLAHVDNQPRHHQYWLCDATQKAIGNTNKAIRKMADLRTPILPTTQYHGLWAEAVSHITQESLRYLLSGQHPMSVVMAAYKYRHGIMWSAKMMAKIGYLKLAPGQHYSTAPCPLCGQPDGGNHILGGCSHAGLKGHYMERHNQATRLIASHLSYSEDSNIRRSEIVLDAGRVNHLDLTCYNRVPDSYLPTDQQGERNVYRPDILLTIPQPDNDMGFCLVPEDSMEYKKLTSRLLILEVGFGSDLNLPDTVGHKQKQHTDLTAQLKEANWKGTDSSSNILTIPLIFGHSGSIPITTRQALMKHLKLPYEKAEKLCSSIGHMAIERLAHIQSQRHKLVAALGT